MRSIATLCLALLVCTFAIAGPLEDFKDDKLLERALDDIVVMPQLELDTLITFVASCSAVRPIDEGLPTYFCNRDRALYTAKFSRGRELDKVIRARTYITGALAAKGLKMEERADFGEIIRRVVLLDDVLMLATSKVSDKLRQVRPVPK